MSEKLKIHKGHKIVCIVYQEGTVNEEATIECESCYEILYSEFKYCPECYMKMGDYGTCQNSHCVNFVK